MQSDIDEREDYDFVRFLRKEIANDAAVAAKDRRLLWRFGGASTTLAICWARSCATTSGDNSSSNGSAALGAATNSRALFARLVVSCNVERLAGASPRKAGSGAAIIAPSTRRDRPPAVSSQPKSFCPRWPLCRNRVISGGDWNVYLKLG
jgi:hypothetical protein